MAKSTPIRFGICGLGFMGRQYFAHLSEHPDTVVVAACDRDADRRAGRWTDRVGNLSTTGGETVCFDGIAGYERWEQLVADETVEAVAVTLPTTFHADVCVAALEAGKHVICEKPMALALADCDRMIAAARRSGRTLMVAQCIRFWPQYEEIKRRVDAGEVGAVRFVRLRRLASPPDYSAGGWLMNAKRSGGALFDLHVHDADFAQVLLGLPERVAAVGVRGPSGGIDQVAATYRYADGRYAVVEGGWMFTPPWPFEMAITVAGEDGTLDWSMRRGPDILHYCGGTEAETIAVAEQTGWQRELDYFVRCVREDRPVDRCLPESSRASIALVLAEAASIEQRREVSFGQP